MIITIDGPAGSGKSTIARKLASRLGIAYLDTGAMYRAVAWKCLQESTSLTDEDVVAELTRQTDISLDCGPTHTRVMLNGQDISEAIRSMETNQATTYVSRMPKVRHLLVEQQRKIGIQLGSLVTEGRDQGSVVFPDADLKFFMEATIEKRAERRFHEMSADGVETTYDEVLENLRTRDGNDECQWAPLLVPGNAINIDTTRISINQVVDLLMKYTKSLPD